MLSSRDRELILCGPYESGKTFPCMVKLHLLLCKHPITVCVVRKEKIDLYDSFVPQFEDKVLPYHPYDNRSFVSKYGGDLVKWYKYPNGGRLVLRGLDEVKRVQGTEYDLIFANQCEQLTLSDWEILSARCTGRSGRWVEGGKNMHQMLGDCNPDSHLHWIPKRAKEGRVKLIQCSHKDNPTLFRHNAWTEQGKETLGHLERTLTGLRRERGLHGKWVGAEGVVYGEFDPDRHVIQEMPSGWEKWRKYRAIDFGVSHPFVCLWAAMRPDGALFVYREYRKTGELVENHAKTIKEVSKVDKNLVFTVADHDLQYNMALNVAGIPTRMADKDIHQGIDAVKVRLMRDKLFFLDNCQVHTDFQLKIRGKPMSMVDEFATYSYKDEEKQVGMAEKDDIPIKGADDSLDALRYLVMAFESKIPLPTYSETVGRGSRI